MIRIETEPVDPVAPKVKAVQLVTANNARMSFEFVGQARVTLKQISAAGAGNMDYVWDTKGLRELAEAAIKTADMLMAKKS